MATLQFITELKMQPVLARCFLFDLKFLSAHSTFAHLYNSMKAESISWTDIPYMYEIRLLRVSR